MSTGIVKSEKTSRNSVEVFWTIGKFGKKLKEIDLLRSVPFYFVGQMWQPLLTVSERLGDFRRIDFSISRITASRDETPYRVYVVCWNMGILDVEGRSHYGSTGFASLAMASEWVTAAAFYGPQFNDLCLRKDMYMPGDEITIAVRLILDYSDALTKVEQVSFTIIHEIPMDVVAIKVKGKTFYAEDSILDGISKDITLKISDWIRGRMTVIELPDCDPNAFECFLSFKDSRKVEGLTDDIAREVYDIADKFQDPELKRECVQRFLRTLNVSSACGFLEMAERYDDRELKEGCSEFFLKNAREIVNTSGWFEFIAKRTKVANDLIKRYFNSTA